MKRLSRIFKKSDASPANELNQQVKAAEREQKDTKTKIKVCTFRVKNVDFNRENLKKRVRKYEQKLHEIEEQQNHKRIQLVQIMSQIEEVDAKLEKVEGEKNANIEIKKDKTKKLPLNDAHLEKVKAQLIQANIEKKRMQQERSRALEESSNLEEALADLTNRMKLAQEPAEDADADLGALAPPDVDVAPLAAELKRKREEVVLMNTRLQKIKDDLDEMEARRIRLQHQREHLKEQSEMFRFMTEEIDRSFGELLDAEHSFKSQKAKLEHESEKLSSQVEKVGKYVSSIQEDISAVHGAMDELSRKKAMFALELKDALEGDKQGKERLRGLRRQSIEAKRKSGEDSPRRKLSKPEPHLTVFARVERLLCKQLEPDQECVGQWIFTDHKLWLVHERCQKTLIYTVSTSKESEHIQIDLKENLHNGEVELIEKVKGTLVVSEDLLLFVPLDPDLHHESFLADIPEIKESVFTARAETPCLSIFFKHESVKFIHEPERLSTIHEFIRGFVIEHESYITNSTPTSKKEPPSAKHFDIDITPAEHTICTIEEMQKLVYQTPSRLHAFPWRRIYSSSFDGISLKTFYGICKENHVNDCILILRDSEDHLLGSFTCSTWSISPQYYGGGDTFVFHMKDGYWETYRSTGMNRYYQFSDESHVSVGQGQCPAIHIDAGFAHGYSQACKTFDSPPLVPTNDFKISTIELWIPSYI